LFQTANKDVPVGETVSEAFPWFSGFKQTVSGVLGAETKLVRPGSGISSFVNTTDRVIDVHEIRFYAQNPLDVAFPPDFLSQLNINNRLGVKVRHTDYELVSEWIPCGMLSTHNNRISIIPRCNLCMTMPTPYYLQAGHPFRVRIRSTNPNFDPLEAEQPYVFQMVLFGKDPRTNKPYEQIKQVSIPYISTTLPSDATPQYVDVVFDDDRDAPMRDLLMTHIGFNLTPFDDGAGGLRFTYMYPQQLEVQLMPPEGPKWQEIDDWLPIGNIVDQGANPADYSFVVYRPDVPVVLAPRQYVDIDVKALFTMSCPPQQTNFTVPLWVALHGTQKQRVA
jgi:hypothetical protein